MIVQPNVNPRPIASRIESTPAPGADIRQSKSAAVGQQAKTAIASMQDVASIPKNIQGKVTSAIARGIDPAIIFAALSETPVEEPTDIPKNDLGSTDEKSINAADDAEMDNLKTTDTTNTMVISRGAESALALLKDTETLLA